MSELNLYRCTPRQTKAFIIEIIEAGLVPYVISSPGMGKSSIYAEVANYFNLWMIDHRLSTSPPEDLSGLPRFNDKGFAEFAPFAELFPIEGMPLPKDKDGWFIFLDEFNAATRATQAASYKLILDKMVGQKRLHEATAMGAAGNLATDKAITNPVGTAMQSRVVTLEMYISFDEWLYDIALPRNYDKRVIAFLSQFPSKLMDFNPNHREKTFCCPRTWEMLEKLVRGKAVTADKAPLYGGTITSAVAVEFIQFCSIFSSLISIETILANPLTCQVPNDASSKWAIISSMMERITPENFGGLADYANRFTLDFRILFFRSCMVRQPKLRTHPAFARALIELSRYLLG